MQQPFALSRRNVSTRGLISHQRCNLSVQLLVACVDKPKVQTQAQDDYNVFGREAHSLQCAHELRAVRHFQPVIPGQSPVIKYDGLLAH